LNKQLIKLAQIAATIALLMMVAYQAGLFSEDGQQRFLNMLKSADLLILIAAVLIGVVVNMISAFKWYMLVRAQQMAAGYWRIFAYYVIGQFYNMFLPTSVGGDFVRSYELGKFSGRQADALASVALALIGWLILDPRLYRWLRSWVVAKFSSSEALFGKVDKLLASVDSYRGQPKTVMLAFLNSVWFYLIAVVNVYITALVFDIDVSFVDMLIATPIIMVIMNLPISFGNLGLMEFGYTAVFGLLGYAPELGLSVAILMRFKSFFDGAIGGILHPIFVTQKHE